MIVGGVTSTGTSTRRRMMKRWSGPVGQLPDSLSGVPPVEPLARSISSSPRPTLRGGASLTYGPVALEQVIARGRTRGDRTLRHSRRVARRPSCRPKTSSSTGSWPIVPETARTFAQCSEPRPARHGRSTGATSSAGRRSGRSVTASIACARACRPNAPTRVPPARCRVLALSASPGLPRRGLQARLDGRWPTGTRSRPCATTSLRMGSSLPPSPPPRGDDGRSFPSAVNAPGRPPARLPAHGVRRAARNRRSASAGMDVRLAPESVFGLARRTHVDTLAASGYGLRTP